MAEPIIRHALPTDDLTPCYPNGEGLLQWNRDHMFVAVDGEYVVGALIFWDSDHPIMQAGLFVVSDPYRGHYIGYRLMEALEQYARAHKKVGVTATLHDPYHIAAAVTYGAMLSDQDYKLLTWVTTECPV